MNKSRYQRIYAYLRQTPTLKANAAANSVDANVSGKQEENKIKKPPAAHKNGKP